MTKKNGSAFPMRSLLQPIKNQPSRLTIAILLVLYLIFVTFITYAAPRQPSKEDIVANWTLAELPQGNASIEQRLSWHFERAQYPGLENTHLAQASKILASQSTSSDAQFYLYFMARLKQHQHDFESALALLEQLLKADPNHVNARLLKASVLLITAQHNAASNQCKALFGKTDIFVASACILEVNSYQPEHLEKSYQKLSLLLNRFNLKGASSTQGETKTQLIWLLQMAADMALRMDNPQDAQKWLQYFDLTQMPVSYLVLWADVTHQLGDYQQVLATLGEIVSRAPYKDDALLMRLAMAEAAVNDSSSNKQWKALAFNRVKLRVARQDVYHAADLARFYLYVEPNAEKAHFWAQKNYQLAKMPEDKALVEQAKLMGLAQSESDKGGQS